MKARAPVDTGTLRDSILASKAFGKRGRVEFHVGPDASGFYAKFPEFGARFQPKRPFMRPAADAKEEEVTKALADGLRRVLSSEDE
jgi:HK97 gp10 family phage protein